MAIGEKSKDQAISGRIRHCIQSYYQFRACSFREILAIKAATLGVQPPVTSLVCCMGFSSHLHELLFCNLSRGVCGVLAIPWVAAAVVLQPLARKGTQAMMISSSVHSPILPQWTFPYPNYCDSYLYQFVWMRKNLMTDFRLHSWSGAASLAEGMYWAS